MKISINKNTLEKNETSQERKKEARYPIGNVIARGTIDITTAHPTIKKIRTNMIQKVKRV